MLPMTLSQVIDESSDLDQIPQANIILNQTLKDLNHPTSSTDVSKHTSKLVSDERPERQSGYSFYDDQNDWITWVITAHDHDEHRTWLWSWYPARDLFLSARWDQSEVLHTSTEQGADRRATRVSHEVIRTSQDQLIELYDVHMITPQVSLSFDSLSVPLTGPGRVRIEKTLGPPNSLEDHELNLNDRHHHFIFHKRSALPLCALVLSLLGSYWGLRFSVFNMIISGVLALGITFGLLRQLELIARADHLSVLIAAWSPLGILVLWVLWSLRVSRFFTLCRLRPLTRSS